MNKLISRSARGLMAFLAVATIVVTASSQPPGPRDGDKKDEFDTKGPPRYELGKLFPPFVRESLNLTPAQQRQIAALEQEVRAQLEKILSDEQKKRAESAQPGAPGSVEPGQPPRRGRDKGGAAAKGPERQQTLPPDSKTANLGPRILMPSSASLVKAADGRDFVLSGDAAAESIGTEMVGPCIRFRSAAAFKDSAAPAGTAAWTIGGLTPDMGRWFKVGIRGLTQDDFAVDNDNLFLDVEFFKQNGKDSLDHVKKSIYAQVELDRKNLADPGTNRNLGKAVWRHFSINVRTPFPEVDTLRVTVGFGDGKGKTKQSEFWVNEVEVGPIPDPAGYSSPPKPAAATKPAALSTLVPLGGRWYFDPRGGDKTPPKQFDTANVDRLYYLSDRLEAPFVNNTSAWLRKGYLDRDGKLVDRDVFVNDSVVISFTNTHLVMKSKNLPNHPTAIFPDRSRFLDGNPNFVREQENTWRIPLEPKENPRHTAMTMQNKGALPMGPIGVAVNGVVFFNPFDAGDVEAIARLDRCCGHPGPGYDYHYHKYPVCINTPWDDHGAEHSPLIGFAFDGFPVYGPYEAAGEMAKDSKSNPLNLFNLHSDPARGPHYHVTPGKFPHIIGGYWGEVAPSNRGKKGPPKR